MQKKALAYFLIIIINLSAFSRYFIYAGFSLNQQYIATQLCVNKDKPQLHCNGKCYLTSKLKLAEEKEKNEERQNQKSKFQEAFLNSFFVISPIHGFAISNSLVHHTTKSTIGKSYSIFQPPRFV